MKACFFFKLQGLPKSTKKEFVVQLQALGTLANEVKADHNATLTKLDADAGVADTNFAALNSVSAADISLT
jgi:hypothetical protein